MSPGDEHGYGEPARAGEDGGYVYGGGGGQTRLRVPDNDPYGGARRGGRSSSRSLVTVVGVVVLLIAAIAFANRGGDDAATSSGTNSSNPKAAPTAASGAKPVRTKNGAGIPAGFARSQEGAQSAAANYAVVLGSTGMFQPDTRHTIVDAVYTADAASRLRTALDQAYSADFLAKMGLDAAGNAPQGSTFVSRVIPAGTTVLAYSDTTAQVSVWYVGLIGMSGQKSTDPVTTSWKTWTFSLRWADGDWKVVTDTQTDGPSPVPGDDKAATSDEISKAIETYGGFTYAR
ncbi:hypothetical protein AQJ30_17820 [Streptomyces longwoodensis]|uniref:DUF8175 domain-containing protein n=1 Tax=Streptomyces longwoodensis TaxID=68231 RepID=A0A101QWR8_9ACTN|nr:hypothetical protein [Streptomyces longwoodensis]KUN37507.1 hypothetical protein AQJ30_17820 [Streptomyces longwoodensis]